MIQFINVTKEYHNGIIGLSNVNLKIEEGEFVYLVGESGAGKSTFTKLLIRELMPTKGNIMVNGKSIARLKSKAIPQYRRNIGFVFQDYRLLEDRTAGENVAFALEAIGVNHKEVERRVDYALHLVGLSDRKSHFPDEMSGGEKQRVAIARAIINNPKIIIADEPTGNLDVRNAAAVMDILSQVNIKGTTVIMATHDLEIVNRYPHRVLELSHGELIRDEAQGGIEIGF